MQKNRKVDDCIIKISCGTCGRIHDRNYICDAKKKAKADKSRRDRERIDNTYYNTSKWRKLRSKVLDEYDNICLWSFFIEGKAIEANHVHHIEEVLGDDTGVYDWDNLIPLDRYVHRNVVHELYKTDCKKQIQDMLIDMIKDYELGNRELGSYKERYEKIIKDVY